MPPCPIREIYYAPWVGSCPLNISTMSNPIRICFRISISIVLQCPSLVRVSVARTPGVVDCPCQSATIPVCGASSDGCGGTCQPGSGCQNGIVAGQSLRRGDPCISSVGGNARLCHQRDGNVVVYTGAANPVWFTGTGGRATSELTMQADGNLVLYNRGDPVWHTVSGGRANDGFVAVIQDDCNFVIFNSDGAAIWNSGRLCR